MKLEARKLSRKTKPDISIIMATLVIIVLLMCLTIVSLEEGQCENKLSTPVLPLHPNGTIICNFDYNYSAGYYIMGCSDMELEEKKGSP